MTRIKNVKKRFFTSMSVTVRVLGTRSWKPPAEQRCDRPVTVESGTQNDVRCQTMEALVGQEAQFVSNPVMKVEPVKSVTHGSK